MITQDNSVVAWQQICQLVAFDSREVAGISFALFVKVKSLAIVVADLLRRTGGLSVLDGVPEGDPVFALVKLLLLHEDLMRPANIKAFALLCRSIHALDETRLCLQSYEGERDLLFGVDGLATKIIMATAFGLYGIRLEEPSVLVVLAETLLPLTCGQRLSAQALPDNICCFILFKSLIASSDNHRLLLIQAAIFPIIYYTQENETALYDIEYSPELMARLDDQEVDPATYYRLAADQALTIDIEKAYGIHNRALIALFPPNVDVSDLVVYLYGLFPFSSYVARDAAADLRMLVAVACHCVEREQSNLCRILLEFVSENELSHDTAMELVALLHLLYTVIKEQDDDPTVLFPELAKDMAEHAFNQVILPAQFVLYAHGCVASDIECLRLTISLYVDQIARLNGVTLTLFEYLKDCRVIAMDNVSCFVVLKVFYFLCDHEHRDVIARSANTVCVETVDDVVRRTRILESMLSYSFRGNAMRLQKNQETVTEKLHSICDGSACTPAMLAHWFRTTIARR